MGIGTNQDNSRSAWEFDMELDNKGRAVSLFPYDTKFVILHQVRTEINTLNFLISLVGDTIRYTIVLKVFDIAGWRYHPLCNSIKGADAMLCRWVSLLKNWHTVLQNRVSWLNGTEQRPIRTRTSLAHFCVLVVIVNLIIRLSGLLGLMELNRVIDIAQDGTNAVLVLHV